MAEIEFNASEGGGWTPLPKGVYDFRVLKAELKSSKEKGHPMIEVHLAVVNNDSYPDKKMRHYLVMAPKSGFRVREFIEATIPGEYDEIPTNDKDEDGRPVYRYRFDTDSLIDTTFTADVDIEKTDKGENNRLNKIRPLGSDGAVKPVASKEAATSATASPQVLSRRQPQQAQAAAETAPQAQQQQESEEAQEEPTQPLGQQVAGGAGSEQSDDAMVGQRTARRRIANAE